MVAQVHNLRQMEFWVNYRSLFGHKGHFAKQVWDGLRIWENGQLEKVQGCDFKVRFFVKFCHLVNG